MRPNKPAAKMPASGRQEVPLDVEEPPVAAEAPPPPISFYEADENYQAWAVDFEYAD